MYALGRNGSRLYRFIAEQILGTTSITMSAAFLAMIALAIFGFACNSATPTEPIHEREKTPVPPNGPTPTTPPAPTPIPTPTLVPAVTLEEPEDGACLGCESPVTLRWSCPYTLQEGQCYQLRVKGQGLSYDSLFHPAEDRFTLPALSPGRYNWAVTVVRSTDGDEYIDVSEESELRGFRILPSPVVHSISPTSTVQGTTGLTVTVSGEHFTHSLALTIGVPLKATFVSTSTITATIPITLGIGKHPVIVEGSTGGDVPSVFFTVNEPPKEHGPVKCAPWNPATPIPSAAPPGYDPYVACIVECCAPAPQLVGPEDGAEARFGTTVELKWTWNYCLPSGWKFAVRIAPADQPLKSYRYIDSPFLVSCKEEGAEGSFRIGEDGGKEFIENSGTYRWNIVVARPVDGRWGWERLSEVSEIRTFTVKPDEGGNGGNGDGNNGEPP